MIDNEWKTYFVAISSFIKLKTLVRDDMSYETILFILLVSPLQSEFIGDQPEKMIRLKQVRVYPVSFKQREEAFSLCIRICKNTANLVA